MLSSSEQVVVTTPTKVRPRGSLEPILRAGRRVYDFWLWLGRRRRTSVLVVAAAAGLLGYMRFLERGFPDPEIHDEFSYLLAADTFASGRVTNPPHPMWKHFESMHIIQQPTYASIYPAAQGLLLGASQRLTGHPWWGVLFSLCVMCGAICWMLQQWVPPQWALIGGLLSLHVEIGYWLSSYWGGAVAAVGGALVLGAAARMLRQPAKKWAFLLALGVAILANSRPYEGLVLTLSVGAWYVFRLVRMPAALRIVIVRRAILPFAVVLLATGCWMAYYNWRVTGNARTLPYSVSFKTYLYRKMFLWQKDRPKPLYRHWMMKRAYEALDRRNISRFDFAQAKFQSPLVLYFGPLALLIPLMFGPWSTRRIGPLAVFSATMFIALALEFWVNPHYSAPVAAALYGVLLQTLRRVNAWGRWGCVAAQMLIVGAIGLFLLKFAARTLSMPETDRFGTERARIQNQLEKTSPESLVIVRYSSSHNPSLEWVYNSADIDRSHVVWARDMSPAENGELIRYFSGRKAWILEPDHRPLPQLRPYTAMPE